MTTRTRRPGPGDRFGPRGRHRSLALPMREVAAVEGTTVAVAAIERFEHVTVVVLLATPSAALADAHAEHERWLRTLSAAEHGAIHDRHAGGGPPPELQSPAARFWHDIMLTASDDRGPWVWRSWGIEGISPWQATYEFRVPWSLGLGRTQFALTRAGEPAGETQIDIGEYASNLLAHDPRPTVGVGAIALDEQGRLLCVQRGRPPAEGKWSVPGGRVELGEALTEAVAREVREETGLDVAVGELVGTIEFFTERGHYVVLDFAATVVGGDLEAGDDAQAAAWLSRDELASRPTTDGLLEFLDRHGIALR